MRAVLDLTNVPTVSDFSIELRDRKIEFIDGAGNRLAWFPAWETADRDLKHFIASDVPLGSIDQPFEDADGDWEIAILEYEGFVYVLEGERRFRVGRDTYLRAWATLLHRFNPVLSLEELLAHAGQEPDA